MSLFKRNEMKMFTKKDFDKQLPVGMFMVGVSWCPHCTELKPIWKQLSHKAKDYTIAAVDAMKNQELVHMLNVSGFPTIFIVMNNGKIKEYTGSRTLEDLMKKLPKLRKNILKK